MEVPINVKDIPLPGEDFQNTINTEINNLTACAVKDGGDIPGLLGDVQTLVDSITIEPPAMEKTEEQLIEEQAAEAIAECIDVPETKEQNDSLSADEVAAQCEIITETPDDSFVLTLNASDLEEPDKSTGNITEISDDKTQIGTDTLNVTDAIITDTTDGNNITGDANNITTDTNDITTDTSDVTDTNNVTTDTNNITTDTNNMTTDTNNITTDSSNVTTDASNVTTDGSNVTNDGSNVTTDASNVTSDASNVTTDANNVKMDTNDMTTDSNNVTADVRNITTDMSNMTTDSNNTPTDPITIPTDSITIPTDSVTIPTDSVTITTDSVTITTDTINMPSDSINMPSDTINMLSDTMNMATDSINMPSDTMNMATDSINMPSDSINMPSDTINISTDVITIQTDSVNVLTDSVNVTSDSINVPSDSVNERSESVNERSESVNVPSESVNVPSESVNVSSDSVNVPSDSVSIENQMEIMTGSSSSNLMTESESVNVSTENQSLKTVTDSKSVNIATDNQSVTTDSQSVTTGSQSVTTGSQSVTTNNQSVTTDDQSVKISIDKPSVNVSNEKSSVKMSTEKSSVNVSTESQPVKITIDKSSVMGTEGQSVNVATDSKSVKVATKKSSTSAEKSLTITEKSSTITEKSSTITEKSSTITEKSSAITEKSSVTKSQSVNPTTESPSANVRSSRTRRVNDTSKSTTENLSEKSTVTKNVKLTKPPTKKSAKNDTPSGDHPLPDKTRNSSSDNAQFKESSKVIEDKPEKSESNPIELMEVDEVVTENVDVIESEIKILSTEEPQGIILEKTGDQTDRNTVYIIEEIAEPIIVDQQDVVTDDQKTTVIEVSPDAVIDSIEVIESTSDSMKETSKTNLPVGIVNLPAEKLIKESVTPSVSISPVSKLQISTPVMKQLIKTADKKLVVNKTPGMKARTIKEEFPNIPCHVLGRNIDNPQEDLVSNGRTPPKPRLGVKVPYRNLTSQIVSRQDIANELIELAAKRNPDPDPPIGGDVFFAKKLTQRLASKIAMKNPLNKKLNLTNPSNSMSLLSSGLLGEALKSSMKTPVKAPINDNSDLLAILEGEVEVDLAKEVGSKTKDNEENPPVLTPENQKTVTKTSISNTPPKLDTPTKIDKSEMKLLIDPEIERIIALKQLEQFPKRSLRGRHRKQNLQEQVQVREKLIKEIEPVESKEPPVKTPEVKPIESDKPKPIESEVKQIVVEAVKDKKKKPIKVVEKQSIIDDIKPTLKVTKTYSRKDPFVVVPPDLAKNVDEGESSETKTLNGDDATKKSIKNVKTKKIKNVPVPEINKPEVTLISKRARIIKKKVIWDPDEVPLRPSVSPKKSVEDKPKQKKPEDDKNEEDTPVEVKKDEKEKEKGKEETIKKKVAKVLTKAKILRSKTTGKLILKKAVKGRILRGTSREMKSLKVIKKKKILKKKVKSKLTELDKLLADEGAVNMLYNVRSDRKLGRKDQSNRAHRDLETRMKAVREVITMSSTREDSPKALRRKSPPALAVPVAPPPRKKSRDSLRSSIQSPPPSPSFIYTRAEASRIIRRHSSSFSSECSTPRRMSLDQTDKTETKPETEKNLKEPEKTETTPVQPKRKKGVPIYVRKADERTYKGKQKPITSEPTKEKLTTAEKRKLSTEMSKNFSQSTEVPRKRTRSSLAGPSESPGTSTGTSTPKSKPKKVDKFTELTRTNDENQSENEKRFSTRITYKEISVRRIEHLVQIILTPTSTKIKNAINLQMFNEFCELLTKLSRDETCRVVLVSSTDNYFCHGIDFSMLMHANADKRLSLAQDYTKAIKEFLMTLANFPKPLVAGVQGPAVGLGVTMLPLFDLVLASDKATFATPYVKLGHVPEGAILLASPHINASVLTSELLFACRKLTASEALQHGLVTRVLWPDKFQEELIPIAKAVSKQSLQCMIATKRLLRKSLLANLQSALDEETNLLIDQWTSSECQQNFKKLLQENEWW